MCRLFVSGEGGEAYGCSPLHPQRECGKWQRRDRLRQGKQHRKNSFRFLWNSESCCFIKHRLELQVILSDSDRCRLQQRFLGPRIFFNPSQAVLNETFCLPGISIPVPRGLPFCHRACSLSTGITAGRGRLFKNRGTNRFCSTAFPLTYPTCGSGYRSFSFRTDSRRHSRSGRP